MRLGRKSTISGNITRMAMTAMLIATRGSALRDISSREILAMPEAMNMFSPKGGVENPMPQQQMRMMPKWIGSTPYAVMMGSRTGVTSMMMARVSINMPRNSKRITTKNHTRFTLLVKDRIQLAISTGIRYEVSR